MFINAKTNVNTTINMTIEFDKYGNLYMIYENFVFQINIDEHNEPIAELSNYNIIANEKVNLAKMIDNNDNINEYYVEDSDAFMDDPEIQSDDYEEERPFLFISKSYENDIPINNRENGNYQALYDTFIYDEEESLCFRTKEPYNEILYRLKIILPDKLAFRLITSDDIQYKLMFNVNDNSLTFHCC